MIAASPSLAWFARHELALFWRDFVAMMTAGRPQRAVVLVAVLLIVVGVAHLIANAFVAPWAATGVGPDPATLVLLSGAGALFVSLMLSQAMESVTRAYYARADLDLILSSPASSRRLFAIRTGAIALTTLILSFLLAGPAIDMLIVHDGPRWFGAFGVLAALSALSTALAVVFAIGLFALVGPKRTRLIAQIAASVVGAGFIIGIQAVAIVSYGGHSRFALFQSAEVVAMAPGSESLLWLPAKAAMGDIPALVAVMALGFGALAAVIFVTSSSFGRHAIAAAGVSAARGRQNPAQSGFRPGSAKQALRRKEWALLRRDPWLLSQTLMQVLYLIPPALLLWLNFGEGAGAVIVIVPVVVMAAGQLAGGLAWLAVSGEDAHDLIVSAPVTTRMILSAKIESVLGAMALVTAPLILGIALAAPVAGAVTAAGVILAAGSATAIQMWFRVQAKRSMFRRRQISSRAATISEAFASIMWAGTAALAAAGSVLVIVPATIAAGVLVLAWAIRPRAA
ncbi:MAG: permease [Cucumibacter sp.]